MITVLICICVTILSIVIILFLIDDDKVGLLFIPIFILVVTSLVEDIQFDKEIDNVKQDFLEGKYVIHYTYIDSIKVDSTYVLKEDIFKHK